MHEETDHTGRNDRVPPPDIPGNPFLFGPVQRGEVSASIERIQDVVRVGSHVKGHFGNEGKGL